MPKFSSLFPIGLRRNGSSSGKATRRLSVLSTCLAVFTLLAGVLQSASASSVSQVVPGNTQTTLSAEPSPSSVVGQQVTYTAKVESTDLLVAGPVTGQGTVDFAETVGETETSLCPDVELDAGGEATCTEPHATAGSRVIKASYSGNETPAYDPSEGTHEQTVAKASTTTTLVSSAEPSVVGQTVTYTATVAADSPGSGTPGGNVTFKEGEAVLCTAAVTLDGDGKATCQQTYDATGTHTISVTYAGDSNYEANPTEPETTQITQTVNKAATTTTLESSDSDDTTVSGQPVTYTATVAVVLPGAGTPTGSVTFKDGTTAIASCTLDLSTLTGPAQCTTKFMAVGSPHSVTAVYSGDERFETSTTESIGQTVNKASTTTALSSGNNPSKTSQNVTYVAVVAAVGPGTGFPDGTVHFKDGTATVANCSAVALVNGQAQCTAVYNTVGNRTITAVYSGSHNYLTSTSTAVTQVVNPNYVLNAAISGSSSDPNNASFTISGLRLPNYRLCVRYFGFNNVAGEWPAVTPPPKAEHSGRHKFGINFNNKCKKEAWSSGAASDKDQLLDGSLGKDDFGFATKGTYEVSWFMCGNGTCSSNGQLIGTDKFTWGSWCPPNVGGFRQIGVWRTSRHKVLDTCYSGTGNSSGRDSHFDKDRSVSWNGKHNEFVARDWDRGYGAPSSGAIGNKDNGWGTGWRRYVGVHLCDRYHHGKKELHPIFMAEKNVNGNIRRYLGGAHYSTATPSISGTWKVYSC